MRIQSINLFNGRPKANNGPAFGKISNRALNYALKGLNEQSDQRYDDILKLAANEHTGKYLDITVNEDTGNFMVLDKSKENQGNFETLKEAVEYGEKFVDTALAKTETEKIKGLIELAEMLENSGQFNNGSTEQETMAAHKLLQGLEVTKLYKEFEDQPTAGNTPSAFYGQ